MALELGGTSAAAAYVGAALASAAYVGGDLAWPEPTSEFDTQTVADGGWFDPATWSDGVPDFAAGDVALVEHALTSGQNVIVDGGKLAMRPGAALTFVGVDESAFQGGGDFPCGTEPPDTDVGLWVLCDGLLDIAGTEKTGWTNIDGAALAGDTTINVLDAAGWQVGDLLVIAPSEWLSVGSRAWTGFEERTIAAIDGNAITLDAALSHDHPANVGFRAIYTAEVMNMTRDVRIEGTETGGSHLFLVSTQPQTIQYVALSHLGVGGATSGRYAMHFHRAGDGMRGTIVRGTVAMHGDNHAYVPHTSHGITFEDVIAYDFHEEPYWWDQEDLTDDVLFDRAIAAKSLDESDQRYSAFLLGAGHNMTVRNSVCVGMVGGIQSGCWLWDADVNNEPNIWDIIDNVAHNNVGSGFFIWQNCPHLDVCAGPHINDGFVAYNNAEAGVNDNGRGINHGAYNNAFQFYNLDMFANEDADIEIHARSRAKEFDEFVNQERTDGYVNAWDTFDVESIRVVGHASAAKNPTLLIDGFSANGVVMAETYVKDGTECRRGLFDFVRTGLEPEDFTLQAGEFGSGMCPTSVIRVQRADGTAYQATDTNEDGVLEIETIPAFY